MASPQREHGYTAIANEIMEALCAFRIPGNARQCLDVILRKTYGYGKKDDKISLSQFCLLAKMPKQEVCRSLRKLAKMNLIIGKKANVKCTLYRFNKDFDTWKTIGKKANVGLYANESLANKPHTIVDNTKAISGDVKTSPRKSSKNMTFKEETIHVDALGDIITEFTPLATFGRYPAKIAKFYCNLMGKTSPSAQLVAAKELLQIAQKEYPNDTIDQWFEEIKGRIEVAAKYYEIQEIKEWNLIKIAENWAKIFSWKNVTKKYQ